MSEPQEPRRVESPPGQAARPWLSPSSDGHDEAISLGLPPVSDTDDGDLEEDTGRRREEFTGPSTRSYEDRARSSGETVEDSLSAQSRQQDAASVPLPQGSGLVKIGLWGAPGSGKTTFLGALRHAAGAASQEYGNWGVFPMDDKSSEVMAELTHELYNGKFPPATELGTTSRLQYLFDGDISGTRFARKGRRLWRQPVQSRFVLDLIDVSGEAFGYKPENMHVSEHVIKAARRQLIEAQGLIYVFDPIGERINRNSYEYVNRTIVDLLREYAKKPRRGPHLPHHVSVCITKFDHPDVFQEARNNGLVETGRDGIPRVPDRNAEEFFIKLCTGRFWTSKHEQSDRSALSILDDLRGAFGTDKIEYFVTSSIGFWRPMGWSDSNAEFDPDDFANFRPGDEANDVPPSIRGAIRPINVLEPLIRLQQRIAEQV